GPRRGLGAVVDHDEPPGYETGDDPAQTLIDRQLEVDVDQADRHRVRQDVGWKRADVALDELDLRAPVVIEQPPYRGARVRREHTRGGCGDAVLLAVVGELSALEAGEGVHAHVAAAGANAP